jgi:hypothetical protein
MPQGALSEQKLEKILQPHLARQKGRRLRGTRERDGKLDSMCESSLQKGSCGKCQRGDLTLANHVKIHTV